MDGRVVGGALTLYGLYIFLERIEQLSYAQVVMSILGDFLDVGHHDVQCANDALHGSA